MSFNRENVVWQSGDSFYIGFFSCSVIGDDPEWDVEYDYSLFQWASGPHDSEEDALLSWDGANPGGYILDTKGADIYDPMFERYQKSRDSIR